jgi:uncharacterized protein (DUF849 family)
MPDKLIIEVRSNEWAMRNLNPNVPYSPQEIADDAIACANAGASVIHYHARNPSTGERSTSLSHYADTVRLIKERNKDLIIMPTLGMGTLSERAQRIDHIVKMAPDPMTRPELAPIDLITCNLDRYLPASRMFETRNAVFENTPATWVYFADTMTSVGVKPALIIWDVNSLRAAQALLEMGQINSPVWCELVLAEGGLLAGHPGTVKGLEAFLDFFPAGPGWSWSVLSSRCNLLPVAAAAMERGGHVSIGLGDYHYPELGTPTNATIVERIVRLARDMGREIATASEARRVMRL